MNMRPISLAYHTAPELDPVAAVEAAAAAGCSHVGLRLAGGSGGEAVMPLVADAALRRRVCARMRDLGMAPLEASTIRLSPATDRAAFLPFCELAAELGARFVLANADDPDRARLAGCIAALCETAASVGLETHFEFVAWSATPSLSAAVELQNAVARTDFRIALDALHFDRSGGKAGDIVRLGPSRIGSFHICDASALYDPSRDAQIHVAVHERLFPGEGALDLVGMLAALPPDVPIAIETPMRTLSKSMPASERVRRAVAATRNVLSKVRRPELQTEGRQ
jgi:sugar phosphate isomerase/epimerase